MRSTATKRINRKSSFRHTLAAAGAVIGLALGSMCALPGAARSADSVRVLLDRRPDGASAPFFAALAKGLFRGENLDVTATSAGGSQDAIERLAKGDGDIAFADFDALIRFRDQPNAPQLKAVFIVFNRTPYALLARRSRGIANLGDLPGKVLGVAEGDLAFRLWPALAKQNGVDVASIKIERMSAAVRAPMLSAGQVDATTGLSYGTAIDVRDRGVPADDLIVFRFADYGCDSYGQAVIVTPTFASGHPDDVAGFIHALIGGVKLAAKDPARAIDTVLSQMDGGARDLELERLHAILHDNILTAEVKRDGIGAITPARFDSSVQQIAVDYSFHRVPAMSDVFDASFLPPVVLRKIGPEPGVR